VSSTTIAVQLVVNGIATGAAYGLVAIGFTVVWKSAATANFAQGDSATAGMFAALTISGLTHSLAAGLAGGLVAAFVLGVLVERLAVRPVRAAPPMTRLVATIGASIVVASSLAVAYGPSPRAFPAFFGLGAVEIGPLTLARQYVGTLAVAACLICALELVYARTLVGKVLRAVGENRDVAGMMGIDERRVVTLVFGFSSTLGAAAGILIAPFTFVTPALALPLLVKALLAAVIGGMGSYGGALLGGLTIGVVDNLSAFYLSTSYRDVLTFSILIALLVVRPSGLLTRATREV
jgi:branched-chain amino acid transport system permease protein